MNTITIPLPSSAPFLHHPSNHSTPAGVLLALEYLDAATAIVRYTTTPPGASVDLGGAPVPADSAAHFCLREAATLVPGVLSNLPGVLRESTAPTWFNRDNDLMLPPSDRAESLYSAAFAAERAGAACNPSDINLSALSDINDRTLISALLQCVPESVARGVVAKLQEHLTDTLAAMTDDVLCSPAGIQQCATTGALLARFIGVNAAFFLSDVALSERTDPGTFYLPMLYQLRDPAPAAHDGNAPTSQRPAGPNPAWSGIPSGPFAALRAVSAAALRTWLAHSTLTHAERIFVEYAHKILTTTDADELDGLRSRWIVSGMHHLATTDAERAVFSAVNTLIRSDSTP